LISPFGLLTISAGVFLGRTELLSTVFAEMENDREVKCSLDAASLVPPK
jgi:hypothetical protein